MSLYALMLPFCCLQFVEFDILKGWQKDTGATEKSRKPKQNAT